MDDLGRETPFLDMIMKSPPRKQNQIQIQFRVTVQRSRQADDYFQGDVYEVWCSTGDSVVQCGRYHSVKGLLDGLGEDVADFLINAMLDGTVDRVVRPAVEEEA